MVNIRSYYGGDGSDPVKWFRGKVTRVEDGTQDIIEQNMQDGADIMQEMIASRGTGFTWAKPWDGREGSYPGREHTGYMLESVSHNVTVSGKGRVTGRFGWIKNREDYFGYQEGGFEHVQAGHTVEGMYALQDAADYVLNKVEEELRRNINGA